MQTDLVTSQEKQVVKMMILLLAKIAKLGWFDDPDIKTGLVIELNKIMLNPNDLHKLIGLQAIDQLMVEMSYMTKMKNVTLNRRISLNFRDASLSIIFKNNLDYTKVLLEKYHVEYNQNSPNLSVTQESLTVCLETYLKCLQFDFIAILLNETLDEPTQTNLPSAWEPIVRNPETINVLYYAVNMLLEKLQALGSSSPRSSELKSMIILAMRCLQEYANVRQTLFDGKAAKAAFVSNFVQNFIESFGNPQAN